MSEDNWLDEHPELLEGKWQITNLNIYYDKSGYPNELGFSIVKADTREPVDLIGTPDAPTAINITLRGPKGIVVRKTIGNGITTPFGKDGMWSVWLDHHEVDELEGEWLFYDLEIICGKYRVKTTSTELYPNGTVNLHQLPSRKKKDEGSE